MGKFHHPHHIYADNAIYFLTARTYARQCYLNSNEKKQLLLDAIRRTFIDYEYDLCGRRQNTTGSPVDEGALRRYSERMEVVKTAHSM